MLHISIIILYSLLLFVITYNIIKHYKIKKIINSSILFQMAFMLYYIIIPIIALIVIELGTDNLSSSLLRASRAGSDDVIYAYIYTVIAYFFYLISYNTKITKKTLIILPQHIKELTIIEKETDDSKLIKNVYKTAVSWGIVTLAFGIVAEALIINSLGGILNAITMGDKLRAFGVDMGRYIPQGRLFAFVLMVSSLASTYFFVYSLRIYNRLTIRILLAISILTSVFYLMINAGRLGLLLFVITFFIDFSFRKTKHPFLFMTLFSIIVLLVLGVLDDWFFYLSYGYIKESSTNILSIVNEFAFPYVNLLNIQKINEIYGVRWGADYFTWIINIIPSGILQVFGLNKLTNGYHLITDYYLGSSAIGGVPTDILTLGMRQFGLLGLMLLSFVIGKGCKFLDKIIDRVHSKEFYFMTLRFSSIMFVLVPYADIDSFIRNRYDMILVFIFAVIVSKQVSIIKFEDSY